MSSSIVMGWNYALQWLVVLPLEIVAATFTIEYWNGDKVNNNAWVAVFLVLIVVINLFGIKGYGEAEFVFAIIKITAVIGFIILGIIINIGGGPDGGYIGGMYWRDPGPFNNGFKGLCSVFVNAAFAFSGTELVGLAAAETANPRKSLPTAVKQVFWRISLFYIVSLTIVGLSNVFRRWLPALHSTATSVSSPGGACATSPSPTVHGPPLSPSHQYCCGMCAQDMPPTPRPRLPTSPTTLSTPPSQSSDAPCCIA